MENEQTLRLELIALLRGENAHMVFDEALADFPLEAINRRPPNVPYSPWQLLEHIRIAQWDILEFIRSPQHVSPDWPSGYWPPESAQADEALWQHAIELFHEDRAALEAIVQDPQTNLLAELPHAPGYTIFREILVVADHTAYHLGEFAALRQVMGTW